MTDVVAKTKTVGDARYYIVVVDGVEYEVPSVNTLKSGMASPALARWQINRHIEAAWRAADDIIAMTAEGAKRFVRGKVSADRYAIDFGNEVHLIAEAVVRKEPLPDVEVLSDPQAFDVADHLLDFVNVFDVEPILIEQAVVAVRDGVPLWAGTLDLLAELTVDGQRGRWVVDWKSGASGIWPDAALTTGGYATSTHVITPDGLDTMPVVDGVMAVSIRPEGWTAHVLDISGVEETLTALAVLARWKSSEKGRVGAPLPLPQ